ncbi:unnamed protein product [Urochloa humidicola]
MAADIRWRPIRASWTSLHGGAPLRIGTNCSEQVVLHPDQAPADLEIAGACCARQAIVDGRREGLVVLRSGASCATFCCGWHFW